MNCPPVDAAASTAPATWGWNPTRFMSGIVMEPVTMTLATALPLTDPIMPLETTAIIAGPPRYLPTSEPVNSMMNASAPVASSSLPNMTKRNTNLKVM